MENLEGMVGSIAVSLFLVGLKTDTTIALIVSPSLPLPSERRLSLTPTRPQKISDVWQAVSLRYVYWWTLLGGETVADSLHSGLQNHKPYLHKVLGLTSEQLTPKEIVDAYRRGVGKPMPTFPAALSKLLLWLNADARGMYVCQDRTPRTRLVG